MSDWASYYVILGSSGAALIGIQFVVMTLIANRRRRPTADGRCPTADVRWPMSDGRSVSDARGSKIEVRVLRSERRSCDLVAQW